MDHTIFEMIGYILNKFLRFENLKCEKFDQSQYLKLTRSIFSFDDFTKSEW